MKFNQYAQKKNMSESFLGFAAFIFVILNFKHLSSVDRDMCTVYSICYFMHCGFGMTFFLYLKSQRQVHANVNQTLKLEEQGRK